MVMSQAEHFDVVILASGQGAKLLAWHLGRSGKKIAVVERRWVGGSCPAVACMPSKNELWSARVAHLVRNAEHFGTLAAAVKTDMRKVRSRKQDMIDREIEFHLGAYKSSGAELIMGSGRFMGPKTIEVALNDGGTACSPATRSSSMSAHMLRFRIFRALKRPAHSRISRRWSSTICRRT
jgi:pyruvate/2-oxoglutarate dehydrogenase complex dihydrolipoamide dehydrogenase (E3) component